MKVHYSLTLVHGYTELVLTREFTTADGRMVRGSSVVKQALAEQYLGRAVMAGAVITHEINEFDCEIWSWTCEVLEL